MRELHEEFKKYYAEKQIGHDVMQIILKLIIPHTYD